MIDLLVEEGSEIFELFPNNLEEMMFLYVGSIKVYVFGLIVLTVISLVVGLFLKIRYS